MMDVEKNLRVVDEVNKAANNRDWTGFSAGHTKSVVVHSPTNAGPTNGVDAHTESVKELLNAFPDINLKLERSFGQGDWVCTEFIMTGTHKGPLKGPNGQTIPPTNKLIKLSLCSLIRFEDSKMAEEHTYYDRMDMLSQLGVQSKD